LTHVGRDDRDLVAGDRGVPHDRGTRTRGPRARTG
jgi:hypothetical protein